MPPRRAASPSYDYSGTVSSSASPRHAEASSTLQPTAAKRRRRPATDRACRNCIKSKTRCEEFVPAEGCYRCRKRHDRCSFLDSPPDTPAPNVPPDIRDKLDHMEGLESRIERLEAALLQAQGQVASAVNESPSLSNHSPVEVLKVPCRPSHKGVLPLWTADHPMSFDERMFSTADVTGYPDVVGAGLVTREQVDMAFQMLKHRLALMFPLHPLTVTTTSTPEHPFLVLAFLVHVPLPSLSPLQINHLVDQGILHALSGATSLQAVLALLLLSLAPLPRLLDVTNDSGELPSHLTPLRAISIAYEMGASLGLEEAARGSIQRGDNWGEPWYSEKVSEVLLPVVDELPVITVSLSPLAYTVRETIAHLEAEAELTDLIVDCFARIADLEATCQETIPDGLDDCESTWRDSFRKLESYRQQVTTKWLAGSSTLAGGSMVVFDIQAIQFALVMRISTFYQLLPSIINPDLRLPGLAVGGGLFVKSAASFLDLAVSLAGHKSRTAEYLPSNIVMMLAVAVIGAHRTNWFVKEHHPGLEQFPLDDAKIKVAHEMLRELNSALGSMVDSARQKRMGRGWRRTEDTGPESESGELLQGDVFNGDLNTLWDGLFGLPDDWLNVDFTTWSASSV